MSRKNSSLRWTAILGFAISTPMAVGVEVQILDVPDYQWFAGCFGTASGNLMGFWDRNGFPDFYAGPTADGVAPLDDLGEHEGIRSMWASRAGQDGRPADEPGHIDDYWTYYQSDQVRSLASTEADPWLKLGRTEHSPDCIGDFIGLSQLKWTDLNGECDGNIDGYSFVFWDHDGGRRVNYTPENRAGERIPDIPSGLREWTQWRGYDADVFSQLTDFNPTVPYGRGFSFDDLKREIDGGYPVLLYLQNPVNLSRSLTGEGPPMARANPEIHALLAFGYWDDEYYGDQWVYYRTSWRNGAVKSLWLPRNWQAHLPVRGVIGFRPKPKIRSIESGPGGLTLRWDGPAARLVEFAGGAPVATNAVHQYQLEASSTLAEDGWTPLGEPIEGREAALPADTENALFYRVRLIRSENPDSPSGQF